MTAAFRLRRPESTDVDGAIAVHGDPETNRFKPGEPLSLIHEIRREAHAARTSSSTSAS
ncbi:hypothetical protein [Mitsuaria sp. GD03876]|uniref:hypothetical protein n=1 Tax=Mitsuaria sp. GD03876 TaxID=2975399 RepID=UPI002449F926|nr:hypothetical protein [Mitsuaria sp. GD03876]MDH0866686.1 hypothetical protein [Mitsuaria sp. GD03876]